MQPAALAANVPEINSQHIPRDATVGEMPCSASQERSSPKVLPGAFRLRPKVYGKAGSAGEEKRRLAFHYGSIMELRKNASVFRAQSLASRD
jgi:hypothetical protein